MENELKKQKFNFVLELPEEIISEVLTFLDFVEVVKLSKLNKFWNSLCTSDNYWKPIYKTYFLDPLKDQYTYFQQFKRYYQKHVYQKLYNDSFTSIIPEFKKSFFLNDLQGICHVFNKSLYVHQEKSIISYNLDNGKQEWKYKLEKYFTGNVSMKFAIVTNSLIVLFKDIGVLLSINIKGQSNWIREEIHEINESDFRDGIDYRFENDLLFESDKLNLIFHYNGEDLYNSLNLEIQCFSIYNGELLSKKKYCYNSQLYIFNIFNVLFDSNYLFINGKQDDSTNFIYGIIKSLNFKRVVNIESNYEQIFQYDGYLYGCKSKTGYKYQIFFDKQDQSFLFYFMKPKLRIVKLDQNFKIIKSFPKSVELSFKSCFGTVIDTDDFSIVTPITSSEKFYYFIVYFWPHERYGLICLKKDSLNPLFIKELDFSNYLVPIQLFQIHNDNIIIQFDHKSVFVYKGIIFNEKEDKNWIQESEKIICIPRDSEDIDMSDYKFEKFIPLSYSYFNKL